MRLEEAQRLVMLTRAYRQSLHRSRSLLRRIVGLLERAPHDRALAESTLDWIEMVLAEIMDASVATMCAARANEPITDEIASEETE